MKKRMLGVLLTAALLLGVSGCGNGGGAEAANTAGTAEEKTSLTVRVSNFSSEGAVVAYDIAAEYGFMEKAFADSPYDVTLEIINFVNGAAAVEAAQAGELDILTSGDQMITTAILENGLPFKVIGNNYVNKKYAFVASKESGIASAANLKGTRVGVTIGNNQYMSTLAFLEDNGYSIEDLEAVNLSTADRYTALLSGDIDWTLLTGKTRENMLNEEGGILLGYNGDYKFNECVFGVSDSFAVQYPEVVTTLVRTFYDATEYANGNPDVVSEILKKNYDCDDETISYVLSGDVEYVVGLSEEIQKSIQRTLHYAYTQGINSREADISEVIDFTYLEKAGIQ